MSAFVMAVLVLIASLAVAVRSATRADGRAAAVERLVGGGPPSGSPRLVDVIWYRLDLPGDPERWWRPAMASLVAGATLALHRSGMTLGLAVPATGGAIAAATLVVARRRQVGGRPLDAVAVVEALTVPLCAGASLGGAVAAVVERGPSVAASAMTPLLEDIGRGRSARSAFDAWASELDDEGARIVANAIGVAAETGGSQVDALLRAGRTLREREALRREIRALASQARTSAVVLAVMPISFTVAVALLDPRPLAFLVGSPVGWACLAAGATADWVGWRWMSRLTGSVT